MKEERWLKAAISDDRLVAELLLRLKDTIPLPPSWGLRQPRSSADKKKDTPPRRSPITPLSFGSEEESAGGSQSSDRFRSKVCVTTETPATASKRSRRKKTFAELKEEEVSLLKERTYLKKELATLCLTLKEQRSMNEKLKRIKLDLREKPEQNSEDHNGDSEVGSSHFSRQVKTEDRTSQDPIFVLPDLNMSPEDEIETETETAVEGIIGTLR